VLSSGARRQRTHGPPAASTTSATSGIAAKTKQIVSRKSGRVPRARDTARGQLQPCRAQRDVDALMKGRHIRRQLSQHEWVAAVWVATVFILARWTSRRMAVFDYAPRRSCPRPRRFRVGSDGRGRRQGTARRLYSHKSAGFNSWMPFGQASPTRMITPNVPRRLAPRSPPHRRSCRDSRPTRRQNCRRSERLV
jgi:hypothetical protein